MSSHGSAVAVGLGLPARSDSQGASSTPPFFRPFVSSSPSAPYAPSAPPLSSSSAGVPPSASFFPLALAFDPAPAFGFAAADELPEDSPPDVVPRVLDPGFAAVPEAARSEFRRMLALLSISLCRLRVLLLFLLLRVLFSKTFSPLLLLLPQSISTGLRGFVLLSQELTLTLLALLFLAAVTSFFFHLVLSMLYTVILRWAVRLQ